MPTTEEPDHRPGEPVNRGAESTPGTPEPAPDPTADRLSQNATPEQVDAAFAQIVASFDTTLTAPPDDTPRRPVMPAAGPIMNREYGDPRSVGPDDPSLLDGLDTFGTGLGDTPEHFEPPPPPPLPRIPVAAILSVFAIIFGLAMILNNQLLPIDATMHLLLGVAGIFGGGAGLIMRLRPGNDEDDAPTDDGAVV